MRSDGRNDEVPTALNKQRRRYAMALFLIVLALVLSASSFGQVQLSAIISGGFLAAYQQGLPEFERTTGIMVTNAPGIIPSQGTGDTVGKMLARGVPADVVIMAKEGLVEIAANGKLMAGTSIDLARTPLGVDVRAGAPKPDITKVETFKQALLRARSVAVPSSTSGIYLTTKLFPQLGIAEQLASKTTNLTADSLAREDDTDLAIRPVSELVNVPGTDFVGTIPAKIQFISVFSGAVVSGSKQPEAAKKLLSFFSSRIATAAIKRSGMEQIARR